jgi:hypothetical protein
MAFHDLETLSAAAVQAVANSCEALVTAEGQEQATPLSSICCTAFSRRC